MRNHVLSEPYLSKLQESRKLMLFDVSTTMEGALSACFMRSTGKIWVQYTAFYVCIGGKCFLVLSQDLAHYNANVGVYKRVCAPIDKQKRKED